MFRNIIVKYNLVFYFFCRRRNDNNECFLFDFRRFFFNFRRFVIFINFRCKTLIRCLSRLFEYILLNTIE